MAPNPVGCQALPFKESASHWLVEPDHEVVGCRTPGVPSVSACSLVGGVRVQEILGLMPVHWWVNPGLGASASLLLGRTGSSGLAAGPRGPRVDFRWVGPVPDTAGCGVQSVPKLVLAC